MSPGDHPNPPAACSIAFKEWEGICRALASGRQSIILRKGGIAEGPGGFVPEHDAFWLYPTRVHQAEQGLKPEAQDEIGTALILPDGMIGLDTLAVVEVVGRIDDPGRLAWLDDLHAWTAETVEKRFHYRRPGLWVLGVRAFRRDRPWPLAVTPEQAGCKTWVPLESAPPTGGLVAVLDDHRFDEQMTRLRAVLGPGDDRIV